LKINELNSILEEAINIAQKDPQKSCEIAREAIEIAEGNNLKSETGHAYYCMAYACRIMSNYTNGLDYAFKALSIFETLKESNSILKAKNIIGIIYFYYGDYKMALENFMKALDLLETIQNPLLKSSILNNVGEIHKVAGDYKKAIDCYTNSLEISMMHNLMMNNSVINANIGEIYYLQKDYMTANHFFNKAFDYSLKTNDCISQGEAQRKLGIIKLVQEDYDTAKKCFTSALQLFNQVNNKFYLIEVLIAFSELDQKTGRNPKPHLIEALNCAIENKLQLKVSSIYKKLVDYHEHQGDFEGALNYHKLYYQKEKEIEASNLSMKLELFAIEINYYKEKSEIEQSKTLSEKLTREVLEAKRELQDIKRENEKLIEVSFIDELTHIYNRRGISKLLAEKIGESHNLFDLILMIDIDYFKKYNDNWGHMMGDQCLQMITSHLKALYYEDFFIGRYGGEEFICYMRVKDLPMAIEIAENIRKKVFDLRISCSKDEDADFISISIGGVVDKMKISKIEDYIDTADKWLYHSKENGRNKVSIFKGC